MHPWYQYCTRGTKRRYASRIVAKTRLGGSGLGEAYVRALVNTG